MDKFDRESVKSVLSNGTEVWYCGEELHRIGGPAITWPDGQQRWYYRGTLHRVDGPATSWDLRRKDRGWWLYGDEYEFNTWLNINSEISGEQKVMLKLQYG